MNRLTLARFGHRAADGHRFGCADCHAHDEDKLPHCHENGGEEHTHTTGEKVTPLIEQREAKVVERKLGTDEVKRG